MNKKTWFKPVISSLNVTATAAGNSDTNEIDDIVYINKKKYVSREDS